MSRGPGAVERKITEIWAASNTVVYTVPALVWRVFGLEPGAKPTRAQRISVLRAARRLLKRRDEENRREHDRNHERWEAATAKTEAELGRKEFKRKFDWAYISTRDRLLKEAEKADPRPKKKTKTTGDRILGWQEGKRARQVVFHYYCTPLEVWAVKVQPAGVAWAPAEITRITDRHVMVRYAGEIARLDRFRLSQSAERLDGDRIRFRSFGWTWYRGVCFTTSRSGEAGAYFDSIWWQRYGGTADAATLKLMPLAEARMLLGLPEKHDRDDIIRAFRKAARKAHPDAGGSAELFRRVVEARDRLLAAIGMTGEEVKMPAFAPIGTRFVWRSSGRSRQRLTGSSTLRLGRGP